MSYYLVSISSYTANKKQNPNLTLSDFHELIKTNTRVFENEGLANKQLEKYESFIPKDLKISLEFAVYPSETEFYRTIDVVGEFRIKKGIVHKYNIVRPCLTKDTLPEGIIDPKIKQGKHDYYVYDFYHRVAKTVARFNDRTFKKSIEDTNLSPISLNESCLDDM